MKKIILTVLGISLFSLVNIQASDYIITDFGAKADGKTINTTAIQTAIDKAAINGGRVTIPTGIFVTGTIKLKSNIEFYLMPGAVLLGSPNILDYPPYEVKKDDRDRHPYHLVILDSCENIAIIGSGEINGNGPAFWKSERPSPYHFYTEKDKRPSPMVEIRESKNIRIEGISITNSPGWTLHLFNSSELKVLGITINNSLFGPNSDGIDITGSKNVIIANCNIKCGDDGVVLKTTYDSNTCENVNVSGCIIETNCVAMKLGTESHHDFNNVIFANNIVKKCTRVFTLLAHDGGTMSNIRVYNTTASMNSGWILNRIIEINANKRTDASKCGHIKNVFIEGMNVVTDGRVLMGAANGGTVENVSLKNIHLQYVLLDDPYNMAEKTEGDCKYFRSLPWLRGARAAIAAENIKNLTIEGITVEWPTYPLDTNWLLLKSPITWGNDDYLPANKPNIISGKQRPVYKTIMTKNVKGGFIQKTNSKSNDAK